jgi:hypothetical protein
MFNSHAICRMTNEHLARIDLRETKVSRRLGTPFNLCGSRTLNVWLGEPRLYYHTAMTLRPGHTSENPLLNKPSEVRF